MDTLNGADSNVEISGKLEWDSFSDAELAWTNWKTRRRIFRYLWKGLCQEGAGTKRLHPTMKPIEVMVWCIQMLEKNANVICDPYMGSGTTGVACIRTGRSFIGIEIDPTYFEIARQRLEHELAQGRLELAG
jgi:site-specific DNA-methyltransferase (adenine-specific)